SDDPLLTSRGRRAIEPLRVVMSRGLNVPERARLWEQSAAPTLVAHGPEAPGSERLRLDGLGVERLELASCEPLELMQALARRGCNQVLWECGPELAAVALRQGCVQRLVAVVAPKLLGGIAARTPLGDLQLSSIALAPTWREQGLSRSGADLIWELNGVDG
ncbi:MAG: dihydrofolate reductase family protein, partial [Cyanobacteria bacterium]|nr:dihydrofolate reductase family protein [Cyanobacteriota bacterium]